MVLFCEFLGTKSDARHLCRCGIDYFFTERAPNGAFFALSLGEFFLAFQLAGHRVRRFPHAVGAGRLLLLRVVQRRTKVAVPQRLHAPLGVSGQHSAAVSYAPLLFSGVLCTSLGLLWTSP